MSNLFTNSFLDLDSLFRDATYIWERRTSLCIRHDILHQRPILFISKLQMLTASHYPSLCLITNASCIVIIAWNLSAIGSRRIRTIIVESFHFEDELIERCVKKHRARHIKDFLFSFLFFFQILYWKILYFFVFFLER